MVGDGWREQFELRLIANWVVNNKLLERDRLRGCGLAGALVRTWAWGVQRGLSSSFSVKLLSVESRETSFQTKKCILLNYSFFLFCHSYLLLFDCYDINLGFLETSASCLLIGTLFCSYVVDEMIVVCILFSGFACTEITMVSQMLHTWCVEHNQHSIGTKFSKLILFLKKE